jgi:DNA repair exonuclease SbcCD ATPase subunit
MRCHPPHGEGLLQTTETTQNQSRLIGWCSLTSIHSAGRRGWLGSPSIPAMETPLGPSQRQNLPNTTNASQNENSNDFATSIRKELNSQRQKSASVALRWRDQLEELVRSLQTALADKSNRVRKLQQERNKIAATMGQMENKVKSQTSHIAHLEVELRDTLESKETESANLRDRLGRAERAAEMAGQVGGRYPFLQKYYI